ncbi:MAG: TlpA family protein disulfide reductase [Betaproteobacteria bacterium]|nr:TlpA family protein disulfide reductase [Betaproteobacteria bacterium]
MAILAAPPGAQAGPDRADFELGSLDGAWIRLSALPPRVTVVNFWRSDCPPCRRELPALRSLSHGRSDVRVVAVALQGRNDTEAFAREVPLPPIVLNGPVDPLSILRRFGNRTGALPHTVVLTAERLPCAMHTGEVSEAWLATAIAACTDAATSGRRTTP